MDGVHKERTTGDNAQMCGTCGKKMYELQTKAALQEERKLFDEVKSIYEKIFALEHVDPTLVRVILFI